MNSDNKKKNTVYNKVVRSLEKARLQSVTPKDLRAVLDSMLAAEDLSPLSEEEMKLLLDMIGQIVNKRKHDRTNK